MQRICAIALFAVTAAARAAAAADEPRQRECDAAVVRNVRIEAQLAVLPWSSAERAAAQNELETDLRGKPYSVSAVRASLAKLDAYGFAKLPADAQVDFRFIKDRTVCTDGAADISIYVFALRTSPSLKLGASGTALHAVGNVEYDRAEHLSAGASLLTSLPYGTSLSLEARKSDDAHLVAFALNGAFNVEKTPLAQAEWRIDYLDRLDPLRSVDVRQERFAAGGSIATQPLGAAEIPMYAGGVIESGFYQSEGGTGKAPDIGHRSRYRSGKLFAGAEGRVDRTKWMAAYGVERGDLTDSNGTRWTKQIVDVAVDTAVPLGASRVSLEARLGAGKLQSDAGAPDGVRFVGGGRENFFVPGYARSPRSAPLFRGVGNGELATASRFTALNVTVGVTAYRKPIVPTEISSNEEFRSKLTGALNSAASQRQSTYFADDPHFRAAVASLPSVRAALQDLKTFVLAQQASWPDGSDALVKSCIRAIDMADRRARETLEAKTGGARFGLLVALLPPGPWDEEADDRLGLVHARCGDELNSRVSSATLVESVAAVNAFASALRAEVAAIDVAASQKKADIELAPAREALTKILYDLDLLSISPLLMADVVRLDDGRMRRGVGAGLRIALVSTVELNLGYMTNQGRARGEPRGAFFITLKIKDFF
ncbi:hypothetical protein [Rhizobacter fulvus]